MKISSLFLRWMREICKNDFASPLQPSEHSCVSKLFEKRKVGFLYAYGNVRAAAAKPISQERLCCKGYFRLPSSSPRPRRRP